MNNAKPSALTRVRPLPAVRHGTWGHGPELLYDLGSRSGRPRTEDANDALSDGVRNRPRETLLLQLAASTFNFARRKIERADRVLPIA